MEPVRELFKEQVPGALPHSEDRLHWEQTCPITEAAVLPVLPRVCTRRTAENRGSAQMREAQPPLRWVSAPAEQRALSECSSPGDSCLYQRSASLRSFTPDRERTE